MNIIVVGAGKVGGLLVEQLAQEGHRVVSIDHNEKKLLELQNSFDVLCLSGRATNAKLLAEAGAGSADLVIAATDSDEANMLCCLLARKQGAKHTIARVRTPELADEIDLFADDMGLSMTINPEKYAAQEIFSLLRFPGLLSVESFGHGLFEMIEFRLTEEGPATSMPLYELASKYNSRALVCAIRRGHETIIPGGNDRLMVGDGICFAAEPAETERFLSLCGIKRHMPKQALILGAGHITYYLIRMMREIGIRPVVMEQNPAAAERMEQFFPEILVINSDGTNRDVLEEEGLDTTSAFISLTGTDEINMLMGMYAIRKNVPRVITKISRSNMTDLIDNDRAGSIVCPRDIIASRVVGYVRAMESAGDSNVEALYRIADRSAEALEFIVNAEHSELTGIPLRDLHFREGILVCAIIRRGKVIIARGNDTIEPGDHVILSTTVKQLTDLSMILR